MKRKFTLITSFVLIILLSATNLIAQTGEENAPLNEEQGPKLTIISGFQGGSNYQMALDIQRMTRKTLGVPQYNTTTEMVPQMENGVAVMEPSLEEGEDSVPVMVEKIEKIPTGDTIDFVKVLDSEGSYYNFLKVNKSNVDVAFLQYDVLLYESMQDLKRRYKVTDNIRVLLPMGTEQIHIITLQPEGKKGITSFSDLKKKRVGIGSSLMGTNITAKYIKEVTGSNWEDVEIPFDKSFKALFNGSIDAFFFVGAKPVADLANIPISMRDKITLISIPADKAGKLDLAYEKVTITPEDYKWLSANVETYAVKALLVTSVGGQTPETEVALQKMLEIIKANKDNSANHPNWKTINFAKDDKIDWEYYPAALKLF